MNLPKPLPAYSERNEIETRAAIEQEDRNNQKRSQDIVIERRNLVLISPDGSRWSVTVSDLGILSAVAL